MARPPETRPLGLADRAAVEPALIAAQDRGDLRASSDPDLLFTPTLFGVEPGLFGGAFLDGRLVGFVSPELKVAVVVPQERRRGIGSALVQLGLAMEAGRGRPELLLGVAPGDAIGTAFVVANDFSFHSMVWDLELDLDHELPAPVWPRGVRARPFDPTRDVPALPPLANAAFADHPTPIVMEEAMLLASLDDPNVRDEDAIVLEDEASGELIGFCLVDIRRVDGIAADEAELGMIGVRPDRQGHGLGRQLIRAGVTYLREIGVPHVRLAVNGRNEGALGLYESEGFRRSRTRERWARPVGAAPSTPERRARATAS